MFFNSLFPGIPKISELVSKAEVFYGANYWSTIITSKNTSKNLSFCCFQDKKCIKMPSLFTLLRFFDELFDVITFWRCKKLLLMRQIYIFLSYANIWRLILCWFMVFYPFLPVLACCDLKIVLHINRIKKNNFVIKCCKSL